MNSVNKTLYIPLYGKAYVSRRGLFLEDKKAEEIWREEGFSLSGKSKSKWLAFYMGIRSLVFDEWTSEKIKEHEDAVVIHIGAGLDSRVTRVELGDSKWYDVDFSEVIEERKRYYKESDSYKMIAGDARGDEWLSEIKETKFAIVIMEGVSMYLSSEDVRDLFSRLCNHFEGLEILVDAYTTLAAKMSKIKNPINSVGVKTVHGIDNPSEYVSENLVFLKEHEMTPRIHVDKLTGLERFIFSRLYAGGFSKKLYRLFEYKKQ